MGVSRNVLHCIYIHIFEHSKAYILHIYIQKIEILTSSDEDKDGFSSSSSSLSESKLILLEVGLVKSSFFIVIRV